MAAKIRFGVYELDRDAMELRRQGMPVKVQEQPFRVLTILVERAGQTITREELRSQVWGDTFVDFEHSLNKAINRLREALNDDAANPRFIETIPRRGYRFIAPAETAPPFEEPSASRPVIPDLVEGVAAPPPPRSTLVTFVIAAAMAGLLAGVAFTTVGWLRREKKPTLPEPKHISDLGWWPTLSRDGKLLAYVSHTGTATQPHIWVRQTAGGQAIPVTSGPGLDNNPELSPDGTRIAFYSRKGGGGIFLAPTLPGDSTLLVAAPDLEGFQFSPDGERILYSLGNQKAFTVSVSGGSPVPLRLNDDFIFRTAPIWSPGGDRVLFYGSRRNLPDDPAAWWIAPLTSGSPVVAHFPGIENSQDPSIARAWVRTADGRDWIIYSTASSEEWSLWRVGVSPQSVASTDAELIASGKDELNGGGSISADGQFAYATRFSSSSIYQVKMDDRGQQVEPTLELFAYPALHDSPSVSRDGNWMAYSESAHGKPSTVVLKDLKSGVEHLLDDQGRAAGVTGEVSISPDGSRVIFERDCKEGSFPDEFESPKPCGFMVAASGGVPEEVCTYCTPRGFSSDGSVVLIQKYDQADPSKYRIASLDLRTRTERVFLSDPAMPLFHPYFSWDDRWVVFKKQLNDAPALSQILIAPVRQGIAAREAEWIAVTDGQHSDDKPQFSADGNTVYFTSTRDGYLCIWQQRLDPVTKHPLGKPLSFEHFHNLQGLIGTTRQGAEDLSVARDRILINLATVHTNIWMTQVP